ncbi:MAG: beta-ribofuranosylaminobenzene 5'-phosphate synthase family protein [Pirellulales bacterium]
MASVPAIEVHAPSRLHFGLFSFGTDATRCFGGVGAMISQPGLRVRIGPASQFSASGPLATRTQQVAEDLVRLGHVPRELPCKIEVLEAPGEHRGLGTGTQLTLAVATALLQWFDRPTSDVAEFAADLGRGRRSAIGTHGFAQGGLLVDGGLVSDCAQQQKIAPLLARVDLPDEWRFVLFAPRDEVGLSGSAERAAFERLPPVPAKVTAELCRETLLGLLPAALEADFQAFGESLYGYGRLAGSCYADVQGGPYGSTRLEQLINLARDLGPRGVGQSSWGPTLFALLPNQNAAEHFAAELSKSPNGATLTTTIASPNNTGARIVEVPASS